MAGYHKNKITNKWYCDKCEKEVDFKEITKPYNYFGIEKEHICEIKKNK